MDRRAFLGALGLLAAPRAAKAQPSRVLGILAVNSPLPPRFTPGFWERLGELGWLEGQNLRVEIRDASNDMSRVPDLATELVRLKVDMIVMDNGTAARQVVDKVTRTLPICTSGGDLQAVGLVTDLRRPEGSVTGVQVLQSTLATKRLEILKEVVPTLKYAGVLLQNAAAPTNTAVLRAAIDAGRALGVRVDAVEARQPSDFERIFSSLSRVKGSGLLVTNNPITTGHQTTMVALAAKTKVPAIYEYGYWVATGGLLSYGANVADTARRLADCTDKILRGAKPADVPVQQPTKFDLVINLQTARSLGLTIPPSLLQRADQLIE